ncbi:MAG: alpha/beta fold hydrolase, partial [Actinomycetota bacterium]|nr:alpha/beta fold hydrolase [Actinomycetota bacterium]
MKLRTVGLAAGGLVAAYAAERLLIGRPRAKLDPSVVDGFDYPPGATHRDVPLSDGGSLHVVDVGSGPPIVLLHGITLSALTWHYQLADLAGAHRVLAVDHRGHGTSTPGSGAWDIDRLALDLVELLDDLDLHGALLVGH